MGSKRRKGSPKTPWYGDGLFFACRECGACCALKDAFVWVDKKDIRRVAAYLGMSGDQFEAEYVRLVDGDMALLEGDNSPCVFLREGSCSIYPARPSQCRTFPFWSEALESPAQWERYTRICPGVGRGRLYTQAEIERIAGDCEDTRSFELPRDVLASVPPVAFRELEEVYRRLDIDLRATECNCEACGRCCRFDADSPRLYCTRLEFAYMIKKGGLPPAARLKGSACPYLSDPKCANRSGRAIGCRSYYCQSSDGVKQSDCCEAAIAQVKAICIEHSIPWDYKELQLHLQALRCPDKARG